jgi:hypothetical protein
MTECVFLMTCKDKEISGKQKVENGKLLAVLIGKIHTMFGNVQIIIIFAASKV